MCFLFTVLLAILAIVHIERRTFAFWAYRLERGRSGILDGQDGPDLLTNVGFTSCSVHQWTVGLRKVKKNKIERPCHRWTYREFTTSHGRRAERD